MAKTLPCFISYKLKLALLFGGFVYALIVLLVFIQILYNANSAIIQFTLADLKGPKGKCNLYYVWKPFIIASNLSELFCLLL